MSASPVIYGGSDSMLPHGSVARLNLKQQGEVVVAIKYPRAIDLEYVGVVRSGHKGNDNSCWRVEYEIRFQDEAQGQGLPIAWEYCTGTEELVFNGVEFELPMNRLGVITIADDYTPSLEVRDNSPGAVEAIRSAFGAADEVETVPTSARPAHGSKD